MKRYIDKSALVAEIERRIENLHQLGDDNFLRIHYEEQYGCIKAYRSLSSFLDTFEVKDVDLEHEIEKVKKIQRNLELKNDTIIEFCAKRFFELGLKTRKGE